MSREDVLAQLEAASAMEMMRLVVWCGDVQIGLRNLDAIDRTLDDLKSRLKNEVYTSRIRRLTRQIARLEAIRAGAQRGLWRGREVLNTRTSNTGVAHEFFDESPFRVQGD